VGNHINNTPGTEISKYREEKKSIEILEVVTSETREAPRILRRD